jgi:hypothetical protein
MSAAAAAKSALCLDLDARSPILRQFVRSRKRWLRRGEFHAE